jgi:ABC-2 type transport system permease protein
MREALIIAAHHLHRLTRRPALVLLLVAVPITLALIEYGAFGGGIASGKLPPVKILFLDEDGTFASRFVPQFFASGNLRDLVTTATIESRDAARRAFRAGEASALIVTPKGFQDALLEGRRAELVLYRNPLHTIGPDIAQGILEMLELVANRLYGQARGPLDHIRRLNDGKRDPTGDDIAEISRGMFEAGRRLNNLSGLEENTVAVTRPDLPPTANAIRSAPDFFATFFPGLVIFALMFLSQSLAMGLLRDRIRGLDHRLAVTPASRTATAAGPALYITGALAASLALLAAMGRVLFGITLRNPPALVVIALGFVLFAAGLQLLVTTVARTDRGAGFMSTGILLALTVLGGSMVPAEQFPAWLRAVAMHLPNGAAQQAFIEVLARRHSLPDVAPLVAVTWSWAVVMVASFVVLKRRSEVR